MTLKHTTPHTLRRNKPALLRLEPRLMFDGAGAVEAVDTLTDQPLEPVVAPAVSEEQVRELFVAENPSPELAAAEQQASDAIVQYLTQATPEELFTIFSGGGEQPTQEWLDQATLLQEQIVSGEYQVQLEVLDDTTMHGALGAFAAEGPEGTPVIYINRDWMESVADTPDVARVMIEEFGHSIDQRLNPGADTLGDEGWHFSRVVADEPFDSTAPSFAEDHDVLQLDGQNIEVELATFDFTAAYEVLVDRTPAGKESNTHDFDYSVRYDSITVDDQDTNSRYFSGNDVYAVGLNINGTDYFGWISRPIKANGVVRGFYFWTDADFVDLQTAQDDGNTDGDRDVSDNRAFLLVVDQAYFDGLGYYAGTTIKNVGSSSDRVDSALNSLIEPPVALTANADAATATEAGGTNNATAGSSASGNVLDNDTASAPSVSVTEVGTSSADQGVTAGTTSANGTLVNGQYGDLTIGADGTYSYVPNDNLAAVEALRGTANTLTDSFTYTVTDSNGVTSSTTLTITIEGANDAPSAADDYNSAKESLRTDATAYASDDPLGSQAIGNVLDNDSDPDRYGEDAAILGVGATATATGTSEAGVTSLSFTTLPSNVSVGYYVFLDGNGTVDSSFAGTTLLTDSGGNPITVASIDSVNKTFTLSAAVANTTLTDNQILGFANSQAGAAYKEATISSSVTGSTTVTLSSYSGNIAVGMEVAGTGLATPPTVTAISYDGSGAITAVELSSPVDITTQALTFTSGTSAGLTLQGQYGTLLLNGDGSYVYTPTADNAAIGAGDVVTEVFTYTMRDIAGVTDTTSRSTANLYITLYGSGASDPNAISDTVTAGEAGGVANATPGNNPSGNLLDNDTTPSGSNSITAARASSDSSDTAIATNTTLTGAYGTLTLSDNGVYSYVLNNDNAVVQALRDSSETLTETFIYRISNGTTTDAATLTITIEGANDTPVATDVGTVAIEASGTNNAVPGYDPSGNVLDYVSDVDGTRAEWQVTAVRSGSTEGAGSAGTVGQSFSGNYGALTLNADGSWEYLLDNSNPLVNILAAGETLSESFNYTVTDRSGSGLSDIAVLTITIRGAQDAPHVNDIFVNEGSPYAVFTVTADRGAAITLALGNSEGLAATDSTATLGTDTGTQLEYYAGGIWQPYDANNPPIMPDSGELLVRVAITPDDVHEGNEAFTLKATTGGYSSIGIGTINDEGEGDIYLGSNTTGTPDNGTLDDDRPTISISSPTVVEGGYEVFTVSLDKTASTPIAFTPTLADSSAIVGTDTAAVSTMEVSTDGGASWSSVSGPVTLAAGESSLLLRIATTDDSTVESGETFTLNTGYISGTVLNPAGVSGTATITDNDASPLSVNDPLVNEASDYAVFTVTGTAGQDVTLALVEGSGSGFADIDETQPLQVWDPTTSQWQNYSGTAAIPAGGTLLVRINIQQEQDAPYEGPETFALSVTPAGGTAVSGTATIIDDGSGVIHTGAVSGGSVVTSTSGLDDDRPTISISSPTVVEGGYEVFTVSLDKTLGTPVSFTPTLADGSAIVGTDTAAGNTLEVSTDGGTSWSSVSGAVTIAAGESSLLLRLHTTDDSTVESAETFTLSTGTITGTVLNPTGVTGTATITDNDITVTNLLVNEASDYAVFTVTGTAGQDVSLALVEGSGSGFADIDETQPLQVWDPTTSQWQNYTGPATIPAGGTLLVRVNIQQEQDAPYEGPESFALNVTPAGGAALSGTATIIDDGTGVIHTGTVSGGSVVTSTSNLDDDRPVPEPTPTTPTPPPPTLEPAAEPPAPAPVSYTVTVTVDPQPIAPPAQGSPDKLADERTMVHSDGRLGSPDGEEQLLINQVIPDLMVSPQNRMIHYVIPTDTFFHTNPEARIDLSVVMLDGTALPSWLLFDAEKGEFRGIPPEGYEGDLLIRVIAHDQEGRTAETMMRIHIGQPLERLSLLQGRSDLSMQFAEQGVSAWKAERDALLRQAHEAMLAVRQARVG